MLFTSSKALAIMNMAAGAMAASIASYSGPGTYTIACQSLSGNSITTGPAGTDATVNTAIAGADASQVFLITEIGTYKSTSTNVTSPIVQIVNYATGLALTTPATSGDAANVYQSAQSSTSFAQRFYITTSPFANDVTNVQFHALGSSGVDPVLDTWHNSGASGTQLIAFPNKKDQPNVGKNQIWKLTSAGPLPQN